MFQRNQFRAQSLCLLIIICLINNFNFIYTQSIDDFNNSNINSVTTIQPDIIDITNQQVNKTNLISNSSTPDLNVDASNHFKSDDQSCKDDNHCEQPNQFCKLDERTGFGKCECSDGFKGEQCDQITDCSMCKNRSKCSNKNNTLTCQCKGGYYGTTCEKNHCGTCVHGICILDEISEQYECFCMNGYTGIGCTEDFNDCLGNTKCQNNGTCIDKVAGFVCECPIGLTGKFCESDINECENNPCKNGGQCSNSFADYTCSCPIGFSGKNCEKNIDDCESSPCLNNGTCVDKINGYECLCNGTGFNGTNCEKNINDCELNPCLNGGICEDLIKDFKCHCPKGFKGKSCEEEIFECDSKPCFNGGICINRDKNSTIDDSTNRTIIDEPYYECRCHPGYKGIHCEEDINECNSSPCHNSSVCYERSDSKLYGFHDKNLPFYGQEFSYANASGYICKCPLDELNNPCKNHGKCVDGLGSDYHCDCSSTGYTGVDCTENINECEENPCQHNSTCIDLQPYYECRCHPGYKGIHCELDIKECYSSPCHNSGVCLEKSDPKLYGFSNKNLPFYGQEFNYANASGYICKCPAGIMGANCDFNINECQNVNCHNGTCKDGINEYRCHCLKGFEGTHCELDIDECESSPCLNGGICKNKIGDFECICPMYTSGKFCEQIFRGCEPNLCLNNGTCLQHPKIKDTFICKCKPDFDGEYCEMNPKKEFDLVFLVVIGSCCLLIIVVLILTLIFIRKIKKARATRGTYSPSNQEFGNSAAEILKVPNEERLI